MKCMIELKPTKLIAVKIPDDVVRVQLTNHKDGLIFYSNKWEQINFQPKEKYKLVGIANKLKQEDLKDYISSVGERNGFAGICHPYPTFREHNSEGWTSSIVRSFHCLMVAHGLYEDGKFGSIIGKDNYAIVTRA